MRGPGLAAGASQGRLPTPIGAVDIGSATVPAYMATCRRMTAKVEGLPDLTAMVAASTVPTTQTAILICFSGGPGGGWWHDSMPDNSLITGCVAAGIKVYSVAWETSWCIAPTGKKYGLHRMAAYPAAIIKALAALNSTSELYLLGGSNGSNQVNYYMTLYGGSKTVKRVIFVSGPSHYVQRQCSGDAADAYYRNDAEPASILDASYGYAENTGPCWAGAGTTMKTQYSELDPAVSPFVQLNWPGLSGKPHYIQGQLDENPITRSARDWLTTRPASSYLQTVVDAAPHEVQTTSPGELLIMRAILNLPHVHQRSASTVVTGTSVASALPYHINPGSMLVAHLVATTTSGNLTAPSGWTLAGSLRSIGSARSMGVWTKVATGLETTADFTFGSLVSTTLSLRCLEVGTTTGTPSVDKTAGGAGTGVKNTGAITTAVLSSVPQVALLFVGLGSAAGSAIGAWGGSFATTYSTLQGANVLAAGGENVIANSTAAVSGSLNWPNNADWAAQMITIRNS